MSRNKPELIYNEAGKSICAAKTKRGGVCQQPPMANGRCRMHGGKNKGAPKGNQNAVKHGIWSKFLNEEDEEFLALPPDERMAKLQGMAQLRAFRAHKKQDNVDDPEALETLDNAFVRNGKLAATVAQARIALANSDVDKTGEDENGGNDEHVSKLVRILDGGAKVGNGEGAGPSFMETCKPSSD